MTPATTYLPYLKNKENYIGLRDTLRKKIAAIAFWQKYNELRSEMLSLAPQGFNLTASDVIKLNYGIKKAENNPTSEFNKKLIQCIRYLIPWRTGPFDILGNFIDSEWKSNLRWDRIKKFIPDISDKIIADIGSGNGYFIFKMLESVPKIIYGFDPQPRCVFQFDLINSLLKEKRILLEPLGIENMDVFTNYFDFVLCMGVIYHRRDPHTCLTKVKESMKRGANLLLETIVIEGKGEFSFSPPDRYMKMRNVWFIPTVDCMISWLRKAGFKKADVVLEYDVTSDEQRRTEYSPDESLLDFLDPSDHKRTVEGYEVPKRAVFSAVS